MSHVAAEGDSSRVGRRQLASHIVGDVDAGIDNGMDTWPNVFAPCALARRNASALAAEGISGKRVLNARRMPARAAVILIHYKPRCYAISTKIESMRALSGWSSIMGRPAITGAPAEHTLNGSDRSTMCRGVRHNGEEGRHEFGLMSKKILRMTTERYFRSTLMCALVFCKRDPVDAAEPIGTRGFRDLPCGMTPHSHDLGSHAESGAEQLYEGTWRYPGQDRDAVLRV